MSRRNTKCVKEAPPARSAIISRPVASAVPNNAADRNRCCTRFGPRSADGADSSASELSTGRRRAMLLAVAALVVAVQIPLLRGDWSTYPGLRMVAVLAWLAGVAVWSGLFAVRPVDREPRRSDRWIGFLALLAPAIVAWLPGPYQRSCITRSTSWKGGLSSPLAPWLARPTARSWDCRYSRCSCGFGGNTRGGAGGLLLVSGCAGLVGNVALQLHCPILDPWHILLGHAIVPWLFVSAWMLWARRS